MSEVRTKAESVERAADVVTDAICSLCTEVIVGDLDPEVGVRAICTLSSTLTQLARTEARD